MSNRNNSTQTLSIINKNYEKGFHTFYLSSAENRQTLATTSFHYSFEPFIISKFLRNIC